MQNFFKIHVDNLRFKYVRTHIYAEWLNNNTNIMVSFVLARENSLRGKIKKLHPYHREFVPTIYLLNEMYIPTCTTIININDMEKL